VKPVDRLLGEIVLEELASATQADDPAAEEAAMTRLGEAQQALAELRQGYPAVDATCIGSGRPTDKAGIHFQRFRCVVYVESQTTNWSGKGRVYVTARGCSTAGSSLSRRASPQPAQLTLELPGREAAAQPTGCHVRAG
jgi:hypothetical protein